MLKQLIFRMFNFESIEDILADFTRLDNRLADFTTRRADQAARLRADAEVKAAQAETAMKDANRAERVRERIQELTA